MDLARDVARVLFGFDIFLSYARRDADVYAESLEAKLEARRLAVVRDKREVDPGEVLAPTLVRAIRRSKRFVLVDTPGARHSPWVAKETETFLRHGGRRMIRIQAGDPPSEKGWPNITEPGMQTQIDAFVWIMEDEQSFGSGHPSAAVVDAIEQGFRAVRRRSLVHGAVAAALLALLALLGFSVSRTLEARRQTRIADEQRRTAEEQRGRAEQKTLDEEHQRRIAEQKTRDEQEQRQVAEERRQEADRQRTLAEERARIARSRELAARAQVQLVQDPEHALLLAAAGLGVAATDQARAALADALRESRVRVTLRDPGGKLVRALYSPDGSALTVRPDGALGLWDAASGRRLVSHPTRGKALRAVAFSPDGSRFAAAWDDAVIRLLATVTGQTISECRGHTAPINQVRFSPDGRLLASGSWDDTARLWEGSTCQPRHVLRGHTDAVRDVAFSPDGKWLVTAAGAHFDNRDTTARVWDVATGEQLNVISGHQDGVIACMFSPDGRYVLTAGLDNVLQVADAATAKPLATHRIGYGGTLASTAFSANGMMVLTVNHTSAYIWAPHAKRIQAELLGHVDPISHAAFSPDGKWVATASGDKTVRIWASSTGALQFDLRGHAAGVTSVQFSSDGRRALTASADGTARIWDLWSASSVVLLQAQPRTVFRAWFTPKGGRLVTHLFDAGLEVWDTASGRRLLHLPRLDRHGEIVTVGDRHAIERLPDRRLRIWRLDADGSPVELKTDGEHFFRLPLGAEGQLVAGGVGRTGRIWNVKTGEPITRLERLWSDVVSINFDSTGSRVVTGHKDGTAQVWDAASGRPLARLSGLHGAQVNDAAFSPSGRYVVTSSVDTSARVWDAAGRPLALLAGHEDGVAHATFSPDEALVVTTGWDKTSRVWNARTGRPVSVLYGHSQAVTDARFSPDSACVLTRSSDKTSRLWKARTGQPLLVIDNRLGEVVDVTFSRDGKHVLVVARGMAEILAYPGCLADADMLALAERRATRRLSPGE